MSHEPHEERAAHLGAEIEAAALRAAARAYDHANAALFGKALRRPVLAWSEGGSRLGQWSRQRREISLSRHLLLDHGWGELVEVLKHEMAHQFVDEVLETRDESAHGPAFRRVCELRGIDSAASGLAMPAADSEEHRALDRVKKLLALATSPNPHEAEAAMATAQRLILKHNLEAVAHAKESRYSFRHLGTPRARQSRAEQTAAGILRDFFFVEVIRIPVFMPLEGRYGTVYEVCGTDENLDLAEYVFGFLIDTAERLWQDYRRRPDVQGMGFRQSFMAGVMSGFYKKLAGDKRVQEKEGLVWVGDKALTDYLFRRYPRQRQTHARTSHLAKPFSDGDAAGRTIELHHPLRPGAADGPKRLTGGR